MRTRRQLEFWGTVAFTKTGCWHYLSAPNSYGYGRLVVDKKLYQSHRLAAYLSGKLSIQELRKRSVQFVRHTCDNRLCINPAHLEVVPRQEALNTPKDPPYKNYSTENLKRTTPSTVLSILDSDTLHPGADIETIAEAYGVPVDYAQFIKGLEVDGY